ncbi:HAD-IB family hydrolase [Sphingomonas sp. IC-56]|uniref:HAD family hydrolase n=1 Tax=Sphingomonas sp. IC-56 TaxID=2898529 RepID=UPI001E5C25D3|nr:HAD-IB family hydrolase [Sphingomonas sp. IC-56]MCD2323274.1 HAD-IB family hydrolase [Sphingomonas sp. IC-56]
MQHFAIYDMDKTITAAPTWTRFLVHAARRRAPWRLALLPVVGVAGLAYLVKRLDRAGLKQFSHRLLLGRTLTPAQIEQVAEGFAAHEAEYGVLQGARERIAQDRADGYRLVMATASHGYYAAGIARRLGFDHVVATQARRSEGGDILSLLDGENCYGPAKLVMVEAWLAGQGLDRRDCHIRAYSDHVSDAPLLAWADEPFAVNAHAPLISLAKAKGWPLLDWR